MKRILPLVLAAVLMLSFAASAINAPVSLDTKGYFFYCTPTAILDLDLTDKSEENLRKIAGALISDICKPTKIEGSGISIEALGMAITTTFRYAYRFYDLYCQILGHAAIQVCIMYRENTILCWFIGDDNTISIGYGPNDSDIFGIVFLDTGDATGDYTDFYDASIENDSINEYYQIDMTKVTFDDLPVK